MGALLRGTRLNARGRAVAGRRRVDRTAVGNLDFGLVKRTMGALERGLEVRWVKGGVTLSGGYCLTDVKSDPF
jgi:hypothetical protein